MTSLQPKQSWHVVLLLCKFFLFGSSWYIKKGSLIWNYPFFSSLAQPQGWPPNNVQKFLTVSLILVMTMCYGLIYTLSFSQKKRWLWAFRHCFSDLRSWSKCLWILYFLGLIILHKTRCALITWCTCTTDYGMGNGMTENLKGNLMVWLDLASVLTNIWSWWSICQYVILYYVSLYL